MRGYIFTSRERKIVARMLAGERSDDVWKLMHRIQSFPDLPNDIALYEKARKAVVTAKKLSAKSVKA